MLPEFGHTDRYNIHMPVEDDRRAGLCAVDGSDDVSPPIDLNLVVFQFLHLSGNGSGCFRLISGKAGTLDQFLCEAEDLLLPISCQFQADTSDTSIQFEPEMANQLLPVPLQRQLTSVGS